MTDLSSEVVTATGGNLTDTGNAHRLIAVAQGSIRFVETWNTWIIYDDLQGHWVLDNTQARISELAKTVAYLLMQEGMIESDAERKKKIIAFALRSESKRSITDMISLARGVPGVVISHEEIDAKPYLLCVRNGTIDLRTGELRDHRRDDLLMTQAPVTYDPTAHLPLWDKCLQDWQPDPEIRGYLQRICGTGISGLPMEALYINFGKGSNGKSKFYEAIAAVLGDFVVVPNKRLLTVSKHEGHDTEKASLFGKRFAIASETSDNDRLNEAQVKNLTGGDTIQARRMRENEWKFKPTHTLFLSTNYQPDIKGTDEGVWRRVRLIPWSQTIEKKDRDERLLEKLTTEKAKSAILNWLLAGFLAYLEGGTAEPAIIMQATDTYRRDEDTIGSFIADRCTAKRGARTPNADLVKALHDFCDEHDDDYPSHIEMSKRMKAAGFKTKKTNVGMLWLNVALNAESASDQDFHETGEGYSVLPPNEALLSVHTEQPSQPSLSDLLDLLSRDHAHLLRGEFEGDG